MNTLIGVLIPLLGTTLGAACVFIRGMVSGDKL